jgi:hypothetical protein
MHARNQANDPADLGFELAMLCSLSTLIPSSLSNANLRFDSAVTLIQIVEYHGDNTKSVGSKWFLSMAH